MEKLTRFLKRVGREEEGQDMVEYGLIFGLVSIVAVVTVGFTGVAVGNLWGKLQTAIEAIPIP